MPRYLLGFFLSPFLCMGMMLASFQTLGSRMVIHAGEGRGVSNCIRIRIETFHSPGGISAGLSFQYVHISGFCGNVCRPHAHWPH